MSKQLQIRRKRPGEREIAPPIVDEALRSGGAPLDGATTTEMAPRFSHDFSRIQPTPANYSQGLQKVPVQITTHSNVLQRRPELEVRHGTTEELILERQRLTTEMRSAPGYERRQYKEVLDVLNRYIAERGNSELAECPINLLFDGRSLVVSGETQTSFPAFSGTSLRSRFVYTPERQRSVGGPIPQGTYWLDPDELSFRWIYTDSWGWYRITIHPFHTTHTFGRGGFFIHGGSSPGSIGCIDLLNNMDNLAQIISGYQWKGCKIILRVQYPQSGDFPIDYSDRAWG